MQKLNTTLVYVLSILGFLCCCVGLGWIPALIALLISNSQLRKARLDPDGYSNVNAMKSARTVAIVALVISAILFIIYIIVTVMISTNPEFACEFWTNMVENMEQNPSVPPEALEQYELLRDEACSKI